MMWDASRKLLIILLILAGQTGFARPPPRDIHPETEVRRFKVLIQSPAVPAHAILDNDVHTDSALASVARGGIIVGDSNLEWIRLLKGLSADFLQMNANDVAWATMSGDATVAVGGALTIAANAIEEGMLKAVNAPADEDFFTYEATTGDFEWHSVSEVQGNFDHGSIGGLDDIADHAYASLIDGTRAFTGVVGGINPTAAPHLTTKEYVDFAVAGMQFDMFLDELDSTINDPGTANDYYSLQTTETGDATTTRDAYAALGQGDDQEVVSYISSVALPFAQLQIGVVDFHVHARKNGSGQKIATIFGKLYHRASGGTETLIATTEESAALGITVADYSLHGNITSVTDFSATDRLVLKIRANVQAAGGANAQIEITQEGDEDSFISALVNTDTLSEVFLRQDGTKELTANWGVGGFDITGIGTITSGAITSSGASTFNSGSVDADFTVNWNTGTGLFVEGSSGNVGIGTTTIPHGGVGWAKFAIDGANASVAGPHVQFTTTLDNYPLMQILNYRHDDISVRFDSYWDGANKSSDVGSNYAIFKVSDLFKIMYDSGVAKGAVLTWNDGIVLNTSGSVTIPNGGLHVGGDSDPGDNNLLVDGTADIDNLTLNTDLAIADGGTGQGTAQLAINALTAVSGATNEHVLTKDTGTGNAVFKAAVGGGGTPGGNDTELQYNNGGAFGGLSTFTWDDTDFLIGTATKLQFRDAAVYIASLADGHLDLEADISIDMNGPWTAAGQTCADLGTVSDCDEITVDNIKIDAAIIDSDTGLVTVPDHLVATHSVRTVMRDFTANELQFIFDSNAPYDLVIIDVWAIQRGTTQASFIVDDGTNVFVSQSLPASTLDQIFRASEIDTTFSSISSGGTLRVVTAGKTDPANILVFVSYVEAL